jgi:hypothetical protein
MNRMLLATAAVSLSLSIPGCASAPPTDAQIADACSMLTDKRDWYRALRQSSKDWGAPMGLQLAIINQESTFDRKALAPRGPKQWFFFPGKRLSSAKGYAQALDPTWDRYRQETHNGGADRANFRDTTDFIGWYVNENAKKAHIGQFDYRAHYIAYHEGQGGYLSGAWKRNKALLASADRVASNATRYEAQIKDCKALKPKFLGIF